MKILVIHILCASCLSLTRSTNNAVTKWLQRKAFIKKLKSNVILLFVCYFCFPNLLTHAARKAIQRHTKPSQKEIQSRNADAFINIDSVQEACQF